MPIQPLRSEGRLMGAAALESRRAPARGFEKETGVSAAKPRSTYGPRSHKQRIGSSVNTLTIAFRFCVVCPA